MKKLCTALMAVAVVASSCQKDLGGSPDSPVVPGAVPADFDWKTTRNVTVSVSAPVVEGATPPYAVIRIYSSPILSAENLAALAELYQVSLDYLVGISDEKRPYGS